MYLSRRSRALLRIVTGFTFAMLYVPLAIVAVLSFDKAKSFTWPPSGFTMHWWSRAATESGPRDALWLSLKTGCAATAVALVLGTLAAFALQRFRFFGRDTVSLMLVLPIALPGIVTGVALNSAFRQVNFQLGFATLVVAHATFCIVTVFNNVIARLRRLSPNVEEASADLGADTFQTFRYVTLPLVRSALLAGALLAFALSFDEIVVTTFTAGTGQTLPLWIFSNLFRPNQLPIVNAVATAVVILSIVPVYFAQRLTDGGAGAVRAVTARSRTLRSLAAICVALAVTGAGMRGSGGAGANHAPGAPTDLRVDEAVSPLWVTGAPTFGWIPSDSDRGEVQTAYRIVVSLRPRNAEKVGRVVWDSGRVKSSAEAFVAAPGLHLEPDKGYSWTVQTWDRAGASGPFARSSPFDTALGDGDWDADWIKPSTPPANSFDDYFLVRRRFSLGSDPVVRARAYISASQQYELYVDGVRVGSGPSYTYPDEQYYEVTDIAKYLKSGRKNVIAMIVHNLGSGQGRPAAPPGVIAHITIDHLSGGHQTIVTNGTWAWHAGPWRPAGPRNDEGDFVESIDARKLAPDWASAALDDRAWPRVRVIGPHPIEPWTHLVAQRTHIVERPVKPVTFRRLANGAYVADFGSVIAATPEIRLHRGKSGRSLKLLQGFLLDPGGGVSTTRGIQTTDMHDDYVERDGPQTLRPFGYLGFRYLELTDPKETLTAADVTAYARHADMPDLAASSFSSSSPILDRVWELARHSALYGSQEQFIDTPTREKGQFVRDAANISSVTSIAFGERNLTWQALRDFARSQKKFWPDGRVNAVYPNGDAGRDIPDFTEDYVGWVLRYYETTGDRATLAALYPTIVNIGSYVAAAIVPQVGLVANLPGGGGDYQGGIVDWPPAMRYGYDKASSALTTVNILAIEVFREIAAAGRALHRPAADVNAEVARATALTHAVNARLRRADGVYIDGLHQDGSKSAHASQQANAYALAAGIVPQANLAAVVRQVVRLGMAMGPDVAGVLLAGLHDSGHDQDLVDLVSNAKVPGWAQILSRGATFTWESWNARDVPGDSESHAWGSPVLVALANDILGVKIADPGAGRIEFTHPRTMLKTAQGRFATERGRVSVMWRRIDARHFTLGLTVPDNVTATVRLPSTTARNVRESGHGIGSVDGVKLESVANGTVRLAVGSGTYSFVVAPRPPSHQNLTLVFVLAALVIVAGIALIAEVRRRSSSAAA